MKRNCFCMIVGLGISLSAQAEMPLVTLSQVEGVVLVNQGKQFTRAHDGMSLSEGDRILTMKESQVALRSEVHGCSSWLRENDLLTITESLNCATLTRQKAEPQRYAAVGDLPSQGGNAATGSAATSGGAGGGATGGSGLIGGMSTSTLILTGVGIAAATGLGVGVGLTVTSDSDNGPSVSAQ